MSSLDRWGPERNHFDYELGEIFRKTHVHAGGKILCAQGYPTMFGVPIHGHVHLHVPIVVIERDGKEHLIEVWDKIVVISKN